MKLKEEVRSYKTTVSVELAQERCNRAQQLEAEMAKVRKKNKRHTLMLEQREKNGEKIIELNADRTSKK